MNFLILILFLHPLVRATTQFFVHLDLGPQFWFSASMAPLVFPDLVYFSLVDDIFLIMLVVLVFALHSVIVFLFVALLSYASQRYCFLLHSDHCFVLF